MEKIAEEGGAEFKVIYHSRTVGSGNTMMVMRRSNGGTENEGLGSAGVYSYRRSQERIFVTVAGEINVHPPPVHRSTSPDPDSRRCSSMWQT